MHLLDQQLAAGLRGDFEEGWRIAQLLPENDPRAAFNKGWYLLQRGELLAGHKLMDAGREINVFGNRHIRSTRPIWHGEPGVVLLSLEGGLGDQIHGVRWAREIERRGCRVVIACSSQLAELFIDVEGVSAVVQHEAACGVYHNYWLPSMSAVVALDYEYEDLRGDPYIRRRGSSLGKLGGRIGMRWCGNPKFEHEQHRLFPAHFLFDAVQSMGASEYLSLQRDEGAEDRPGWALEVPLGTWVETAEAVSACDLVVTSCTSIAHLAGALGVPTLIVVPVLSYFLWALPGPVTPYYNSVTLFRQEKHGEWDAPFASMIRSVIPGSRAA